MIHTIKHKLQPIFIIVFLAAIVFATQMFAGVAGAQGVDIQNQTRCGSNISLTGDGCDSNVSGGSTGIEDIIKTVINVFSAIVGAIAVIMIIVGGFRYITSGGDSNNVGGAKNTIIYAIVGLVIVALAQIIVKFVLEKSTGA